MATHSINLRVNEKTFTQWARSLVNLRRTFTVPVERCGNVSNLPPLPSHFRFSGVRLLLETGLACVRPDALDDPSRLFAMIKYAGSIASRAELRLARAVADMDSHKLAVLSDEVGCGFSFLVARKLLGANRFLDLKTAIAQKWVKTPAPKSRQPDYIAYNSRLPSKLMVVEAKGTQSGATRAIKQVLSGCGQVSRCAVQQPASTIERRMVVGALLTRENQRVKTKVLVGDPDEVKPYEYSFAGRVDRAVSTAHFARLATLTGDTAVLARLADRRRLDFEEPEPDPVNPQRAVGSLIEVSSGASSMRLFLGLQRSVRERLLDSDLDEAFDVLAAESELRDALELEDEGLARIDAGPEMKAPLDIADPTVRRRRREAEQARKATNLPERRELIPAERTGLPVKRQRSLDEIVGPPENPAQVLLEDGLVLDLVVEGPLARRIGEESHEEGFA